MTTAFERIRDNWVPIWLKGFERNSRDYNSNSVVTFEPHTVLGLRGQFADIWRKIWKLKKAFWDDETLEGEQPLEIIDDLISHLFLTRDLLLMQQKAARCPEVYISDSGDEMPCTLLAMHAEEHSYGYQEPLKPMYLKTVTGHGYDGCPVCVKARQQDPELIV